MHLDFNEFIKPLLKKLEINPDELQRSDHYSIRVPGNLEIQLMGAESGDFFMAAEIGYFKGREDSDDLAWRLLEFNFFDEIFPPIQVSANAEKRKVILWAQLLINGSRENNIINLFERFSRRATNLVALLNDSEKNKSNKHAPLSKNGIYSRIKAGNYGVATG